MLKKYIRIAFVKELSISLTLLKKVHYKVFDSFAVMTAKKTVLSWSNELSNKFSLKTPGLATLQKIKIYLVPFDSSKW